MTPIAPTTSPIPELTIRDFHFHLPEELIAQQPPAERGSSRMLVVPRDPQPEHADSIRHSGSTPLIKPSQETGASPAAEKPNPEGSLQGQDFSRAETCNKIGGALYAAEEPNVEGFVTGQDLSRAETCNKIGGALAPEGSFLAESRQISTFSTACLAPESHPAPFADLHFHDLPSLLHPGDLLVLNDSRVIPARLFARRANSRGKQDATALIEVLLTAPTADGNPTAPVWQAPVWQALVRPGRKVRPGDTLEFFPRPTLTLSEGEGQSTQATGIPEGAGAFRPLNQPQRSERGFSPGPTASNPERFVTGHDFSRADKANSIHGALQPAEEPSLQGFVTGHDFSRADTCNEINGALAPERSSLPDSPQTSTFSPAEPVLRAQVLASGSFGERTLRFEPVPDFYAALEAIGHIPLPPYIQREDATSDRERYQTVFAAQRGSVAAPTAGLHFTPEILTQIAAKGIEIAKITLHVGLGTFAPLRAEKLSEIQLHTERYTLPAETAQALNRARAENRRIVAVGTTTVRTLEHVARQAQGQPLQPHSGETQIFISPGHQFQLVDALLTNFHLPQSSLLMLVSAFAGRERTLAAYHHAVQQKYRFFSYGDCMFLV